MRRGDCGQGGDRGGTSLGGDTPPRVGPEVTGSHGAERESWRLKRAELGGSRVQGDAVWAQMLKAAREQ